MSATHILTPRKRRLKPTLKVLKNKITMARVTHTLRCGCELKPGFQYHQVVALVNGQFTITKQHFSGKCIELVN
jgi:hypothetical protein